MGEGYGSYDGDDWVAGGEGRGVATAAGGTLTGRSLVPSGARTSFESEGAVGLPPRPRSCAKRGSERNKARRLRTTKTRICIVKPPTVGKVTYTAEKVNKATMELGTVHPATIKSVCTAPECSTVVSPTLSTDPPCDPTGEVDRYCNRSE